MDDKMKIALSVELLKITLGGMEPRTADEVVKAVIKILEGEQSTS